MGNNKSTHLATIIFLIMGIFLIINNERFYGSIAIIVAVGSMIVTAQKEKRLKKPDGDKFFDKLG